MVTMIYEGLDDEKELEMVSIVNQNKIVSDSNCDSDDENDENIFDKDIDEELEATPKTTVNG